MSHALTGYLFPNDVHILWSLMIVMYPYITGLVAGAFIVSSLYHVFGRTELRPVARLSMSASLAFLLVATLPLLFHLGHPERSLNIVITPHFTSAMAAFGLIYTLYLTLLVLEIWLVYRKDIILTASRSRGLKRWIFATMALGVYDISEEALRVDRRVITVLAALGIPAACILHGYVGFMFGSVKANYWWSTPLMPVIFLFSAVMSGMAMVIILYLILMRFANRPIDPDCVQSLARWLWLFVVMTVTMEMLEIVTLAYERNEEWVVIAPLLNTKLAFSFVVVQVVFGSLIPILLLGIVVLMQPFLTSPLRNTITFIASLILLIQVFAMRWNVVIGGQIFSKSLSGFRESYHPQLLEKEGILSAVLIFIVPFVFLALFNKFLPLYGDAPETKAATTEEG
ncbi:MAG: polysulfide reductase NrfD [Candidatus Hydrogenedentes bacterium]|nr:polysulfide reductase NrfD [Candidatus Hydrogenedentota bacterium]